MIKGCKIMPVLLFILAMSIAEAATIPVYNQTQLYAAVKNAKAGDTIVLDAKAAWQNINLVIDAQGTKSNPVVIRPSEGYVSFTGNSSIKVGGSYCEVSGIDFHDGYSKGKAIVEFRTAKLAEHCRVSNCRFTNYSKPQRFDTDHWIIFYGNNNRFDHNYIGDKLNSGTTIIVELNDEKSRLNYHSIDSNFFAGRSRLGSNGGETIRIGVSRYSMTSSNTQVKDNFFYHCNGEVEIISIKSCNNTVLNNTFFECEGSVVLRHGQSSTVANNVFIGNNKPFTGGVRVIDSGHRVLNNVFIGLTGDRFRSALAVMNAVPNSLPNRYVQVKDALIQGNLFYNCKSILFGAGKDVERTLAPDKVAFVNNTIYSTNNPFFGDENNGAAPITFKDNYVNQSVTIKAFNTFKAVVKKTYFVYTDWNRQEVKSFLTALPYGKPDITALHWLTVTPVEEAPEKIMLPVKLSPADIDSMMQLLASKQPVNIVLSEGRYEIPRELLISHTVRITGKGKVEWVNGTDKSLPGFFIIGENAKLYVTGITFNANYKNKGDVQSAITTTKEGLLTHYTLDIKQCAFVNFNEGGYSAIKATKGTYADKIAITDCSFANNAGICIDLGAEKDDKGTYNAEELIVKNCLFQNNLGPAINVYRGGNDESTSGPSVLIDHCVFDNVDNREQSYVVRLMGVQYGRVFNSSFVNSGSGGRSIWFEEYSWDDLLVDYCNFYQSGRVQTFHGKLLGKHIYHEAPASNGRVPVKGTDASAIGLVK